MKLVRLLAVQMTVWPVKNGVGIHGVDAITQGVSGDIYTAAKGSCGYGINPQSFGTLRIIASDTPEAFVTQAEWELEKKRVRAESWNGEIGSIPPNHAFCKVIRGGCEWREHDEWMIGETVEVLGVVTNHMGEHLMICQMVDGSVYAFLVACLVRAKTEAEERAGKVDDMAKILFNDCRLGTDGQCGWDFAREDTRVMYRNAISAGWVKP